VAAGRGEVSLQGLSRQITGLTTANGRHEVGQMGGFQSLGANAVRDVLDLLSFIVKDRPAGGIAREVTPFAGNDHTVVLVAEPPHRGNALGDAHVADFANERGGLVIQERDLRVGRLAAVIETKPAADADGARRRWFCPRPSGKRR